MRRLGKPTIVGRAPIAPKGETAFLFRAARDCVATSFTVTLLDDEGASSSGMFATVDLGAQRFQLGTLAHCETVGSPIGSTFFLTFPAPYKMRTNEEATLTIHAPKTLRPVMAEVLIVLVSVIDDDGIEHTH